MTSESHGGFFQFPLCLLATREPLEQWAPRAFCYGVVDFINRTEQSETDFAQMSAKRQTHCFDRAKKIIGFTGGTASDYLKTYLHVRNAWMPRFEKNFHVRLKTTYYFEMRDERMLSERDFRILIGLYSMIGPKPFAKAGWPMIQARAAGHLSMVAAKFYDGQIYSRWQIEQAVAELLNRKLLASVTYNRGERFWSHRLSATELAAAVTSAKTRIIMSRQERAALNAQTSLAISDVSRVVLTCRSGAGNVLAPAGHRHVPSTSPSTGARTSPSTLQESPALETLTAETPSSPAGLRPDEGQQLPAGPI